MPHATPLSRDLDTLRPSAPHISKGPVPTAIRAIRASRAKLTALSLRRFREELFRRQLVAIQDMVDSGVDAAKIADLSHTVAAGRKLITAPISCGSARPAPAMAPLPRSS
jgi:hypothetical protein